MFLPLLFATAALAGDYEISSYAPLKQMSLEAVSVRQDMENVLLAVSVNQANIQRAREDLDRATRASGLGSNDHALAKAHLDAVTREALSSTLDQLEQSAGRLAQADARTASFVRNIAASPRSFEALVKAQLSQRRSPEVTAVILHMAIRKLRMRCEEMMAEALIGQLEFDLKEIEETLKLLAQLGGGSEGGSRSLDEALQEFMGASSQAADGPVDELDRLLKTR